MRLRRRFNDLLTERNVMNLDMLADDLSDLESHVRGRGPNSAKAVKWINTTLRKWLINDYDDDGDVRLVRKLPNTAPGWAKTAFERGEQLWSVMLNPASKERFRHILDWLLQAQVRDITRVSVPDAMRQTEEWDAELRRKKAETDAGAVTKIMDLPGSMTLVKLEDDAAFKWEGSHMGHCVASYDAEFYTGKTNKTGIYSVRDRKGMPHVTIEVIGRNVMQIKGKENKAPTPKYMSAVSDAFAQQFRGYDIKEPSIIQRSDGGICTWKSLKKGDKIAGKVDIYGGNEPGSETLPGGFTCGELVVVAFDDITLEPGTTCTTAMLMNSRTDVTGITVRDRLDLHMGSSTYIDDSTIKKLNITDAHAARISIESSKISELSVKASDMKTSALTISKSDIDRAELNTEDLTFSSKRSYLISSGAKYLDISGSTIKTLVVDFADFTSIKPKFGGASVRRMEIKSCNVDGLDMRSLKCGSVSTQNSTINGDILMPKVDSLVFGKDTSIEKARIKAGTIGSLTIDKYAASSKRPLVIAKGAKIGKITAPEGAVVFE